MHGNGLGMVAATFKCSTTNWNLAETITNEDLKPVV
jgi:hypothetical protein